MSEDLHDIDKLFKESIEEHAEAPPSHVWERLDNKLDQRRVAAIAGRYNMLKWVAAALFLISVGMAMWVYHLRTQPSGTNLAKGGGAGRQTGSLSSKQTETAQKQTIPSATNNIAQAPPPAIKDPAQNGAASVPGIPPGKDSLAATDVLATEGAVPAPEKPRPERVIQQGQERTVQAIKDKQLKGAEAKRGNDKKALAKNGSRPLERSLIAAASPRSESLIEQPVAEEALHPTVIADPRIHENSAGVDLSHLPKPVLLTLLPGSTSPDVPAPIRLTPRHVPVFTATVFFSPNLVSSTVTNDSQVPYGREDDKNEIKANEQNGTSHSIGALLNYHFNEHWSIGSGLVVSSRTTEIKAKTIYARPDPRGGGIKYRFNCSSGYSYINLKPGGSNPFNGDSAKAVSSINKLQYLSVPLIATYSFGGSKLRFLTSAGVQANFLTVRKIETFITKGTIREFANTSDIQGLRSVYLSGIIGAGASYKLTRTLTASIVPTAQLGFMSINQHAPVKSYINFYGLAMGLSVKL